MTETVAFPAPTAADLLHGAAAKLRANTVGATPGPRDVEIADGTVHVATFDGQRVAFTGTPDEPTAIADEHEDLDTLTRADLAELDGPAYTVACVLDGWNRQRNDVIPDSHGAGLFLDLLAAEGYRVTPIGPLPSLDQLLPPPTE